MIIILEEKKCAGTIFSAFGMSVKEILPQERRSNSFSAVIFPMNVQCSGQCNNENSSQQKTIGHWSQKYV